MLPGVPWYGTHTHPGGNIPGCPVPSFQPHRPFPLGATGVFSEKKHGKHVFSGVRSGFCCVRRALTRDPTLGSRGSLIPHQTKRRVFPSLLANLRNPGNRHFPDFSGSGPHSNQRTTGTGSGRFLAHFRHLVTCARNPVFLGFRILLIQRVG